MSNILSGQEEDIYGLIWLVRGWDLCWYGGTALLWFAAVLTMLTGWDYMTKAWPHLKDEKQHD